VLQPGNRREIKIFSDFGVRRISVKFHSNAHEIEQAAAIAPPYAGYGFQPLRTIRGANARKLTMSQMEVRKNRPLTCENGGGGERTRTADFHVANVALYQLSYTPGRSPEPTGEIASRSAFGSDTRR
jgi:hypothetical protein